jgi:uncharacterized coiled-coil protein SlyX
MTAEEMLRRLDELELELTLQMRAWDELHNQVLERTDAGWKSERMEQFVCKFCEQKSRAASKILRSKKC